MTRGITDSFLFAYEKEQRKSNSKDTSNADVVKCMMVDVILGGADTKLRLLQLVYFVHDLIPRPSKEVTKGNG